MKTRFIFIIALINFLIQTSWLQYFRINGVLPNTSLVLVVVFGALYGRKEGLRMALFTGMFQDLFVSKVLFLNLTIYVIVAWIIGSFEESLFKDNFLTPLLLSALSTLSYHAMWLGMIYLLGATVDQSIMSKVFVLETTLNGIIGVFLYGAILKHIYGYGLR